MGKILSGQVKWILVTLIAIGGLAALLGAASQAIWTSTATVPSNQFTTGSVTIGTTPTSTLLSLSLAKPGDTDPVSGGAQLLVDNTGTLDFLYDVTVAVTACTGDCSPSPLESELKLEINGVDVTTPGVPCDDFDGAVIYALGDVVPAGGNLFLDRTLTVPAGSEVLCFSVVLPDTAGNALQSLSNTTTFTFDSEQTANNP